MKPGKVDKLMLFQTYTANNYLFKVNNRNTRKRCEICSKLTIKRTERRHLRRSGVFIAKFEHISPFSSVFIVTFLAGYTHLIALEVYIGLCQISRKDLFKIRLASFSR